MTGSKCTPAMLNMIGNTPLVCLERLLEEEYFDIYVKLEYYNPTGSIKDRIALRMIEDAEKAGLLKPGYTVVEPTSGNTGCSLAFVCAMKGYRMIATMPAQMSQERKDIIQAFGADLILCQGAKDPEPGMFTQEDLELTVSTAEELAKQEGFYMPNQFANPSNSDAHRYGTAKEIWDQMDGRIDAVIAAVGTAGTAVGLSQGFKELDPDIEVHVVEPDSSAVISGDPSGFHRIQGIGEGFIPDLFDRSLFDGVIRISDDEAKAYTCKLARIEGIFGGYSSGANVLAAMRVGRKLGKGARIVTLIPDSGMKYLSTELYHHRPEVCAMYCCRVPEEERTNCKGDEKTDCCASHPCV